MVKRALCVGINDYPFENSDLNGCVNDANAWADLLTGHFDFAKTDVKLMLDAEVTKRALLDALGDLLAGVSSGDVLVFTNSSHGSYRADSSGDEAKYDQVVCPFDVKDNVVIDDELRELFSAIPAGVHLAAIMDNCHSGSGTRVLIDPNAPDQRRRRFLNPQLRGDPVLNDPFHATPKQSEKYPESGMNEILLSGCNSVESSYDAQIEGTYHGAMSFYAIKAIREANYALTYQQLHARLVQLVEAEYPQHPQLEGKDDNKNRGIFI